MSPEEFLVTQEAKDNVLKQEFMDDIRSKKEMFKKLAEDELLMTTSSYKENLAQIASLHLTTDCEFGIDDIKK